MNPGKKIIDAVIGSKLLSPLCAEDESHAIVIVWSSSAEEQLEAIVPEEVNEVQKKWESDQRIMHGCFQLLKENGLMPSSSELISAYRRSVQ